MNIMSTCIQGCLKIQGPVSAGVSFRLYHRHWPTCTDGFRILPKRNNSFCQPVLFRKIIIVFSAIHIKHRNVLCDHNTKFMNVKTAGTCSNNYTLNSDIQNTAFLLL